MAPRPLLSVTVDLDTLTHYRAIHGLDGGARVSAPDPAYQVALPRMLSLFEDCQIQSTLFVIGQDVDQPSHRAALRDAHQGGHELASHSQSHRYDLRHQPLEVRREELARAEEAIASVDGGRGPVGFRTPGYNVDQGLLELCAERGYRYDSSVFPCPPYYLAKAAVMGWLAVRGRPSRSAMCEPQTLLAPITPYRPDEQAYWRRASGPTGLPVEIPMCLIPGVRFPVIGTSLHLLGARGFHVALPALRRRYRRLLQLEFHAVDFLDSSDPGCGELAGHQPDLRVPWEDKRALYGEVFRAAQEHYRPATLEAACEDVGWLVGEEEQR